LISLYLIFLPRGDAVRDIDEEFCESDSASSDIIEKLYIGSFTK